MNLGIPGRIKVGLAGELKSESMGEFSGIRMQVRLERVFLRNSYLRGVVIHLTQNEPE